MKLLSKSKYLLGIQCHRQIWVNFNQPEKLPEIDIHVQHRFDDGHEVGELAKLSFPGGIDLPTDDFMGNIQLTQASLQEGKPLFEPGFMTEDRLFSRGDVLVPNEDGWDVVEVKSGTKVKDINVHDVAFQKYVYEKKGLKIKNCFLMHLNNQYVREGELDPQALFVQENITEQVEEIYPNVSGLIEDMKETIDDPIIPDNKIGSHCSNPYDCPLQEECWSFLPENHVAQLYRGKAKAFELIEGGIYALSDIPDEFKLNDKQDIQKECDISGKPHIHKESLKHFLDGLKYPLYYLDFETFSTAVPKFDGLKPYSQVPFQYSLHVVDSPGAEPKHYSFLYKGNGDPRKEFISELEKVLGEAGDIVVYNQSFEINRLKELGIVYPEYQSWVEGVVGRVVDLLVPFRNFSYYHPMQKGSASIKKVLPALVEGKSYSGMEIADGGSASLEYYNTHYGDVSAEEKARVRKALEKYCHLDTISMVWMVDTLGEIVKNEENTT
jgi:hypothetical protein